MTQMSSETNTFSCQIDWDRRVITIQGIKYAFEVFNSLAFSPKGQCFKIGERSDGVLELIQIFDMPLPPPPPPPTRIVVEPAPWREIVAGLLSALALIAITLAFYWTTK